MESGFCTILKKSILCIIHGTVFDSVFDMGLKWIKASEIFSITHIQPETPINKNRIASTRHI
jgi:hypothetical protein